MLSSLRKCHQSSGVQGLKASLAFTAAALTAGCSADVSRFDLGNGEAAKAHSNYASSGSGYSSGQTGRTASTEFGSAGYDRPAYGGSGVSRQELPAAEPTFKTSALPRQDTYPNRGAGDSSSGSGYGQQRQQGYGAGQPAPQYGNSQPVPQYGGSQPAPQYGASRLSYPEAAQSRGDAAVAPIADGAAGTRGDTIEVRPGDTLYGLSRRHNVSINELKSVNGLSGSDLKPGQKLHLPAGARAGRAGGEGYATAAAREPAQSAADVPSDWTGSYTVQPRDSLYAIARQHGTTVAEIQRHNGISDARKVRPGTELKLPGGSSATVAEAQPAPEAQPEPEPEPERATQTEAPPAGTVRLGAASSTAQQPTLLNGAGSDRVAAADAKDSASDAVMPAKAAQTEGSVAGSSRLRWPVAGKMINGFGPRPDGTHNDGVNLAAPMGTDIHAAEGGVVAYSGDELKGYGNLVLIRHDNGWVTAYAHADELLVKRGDRIKRGQVIAKAGRTGQVDQPQVHFELRQGQKPVDPTPYMERL